MDSDGMVVGSVGEDGAAAEALAGEFGMVLREAQGLAEARGWGSLRTFAVAGTHARVAFAAVPGGLVLALVGGPLALVGRLRRAVESAAPGFGAL
jgi:predicted regulator of Ras-like GTPase activity (Roadblock/LC7/MglB family)